MPNKVFDEAMENIRVLQVVPDVYIPVDVQLGEIVEISVGDELIETKLGADVTEDLDVLRRLAEADIPIAPEHEKTFIPWREGLLEDGIDAFCSYGCWLYLLKKRQLEDQAKANAAAKKTEANAASQAYLRVA